MKNGSLTRGVLNCNLGHGKLYKRYYKEDHKNNKNIIKICPVYFIINRTNVLFLYKAIFYESV